MDLQQHQSEAYCFLPQQKPDVGFIRSLQKYVLGNRNLLSLEDMKMFLDKKDELFPPGVAQTQRELLEKSEDTMNNRILASVALGGAFVVSLQRYFPTRGNLSLGRMLADVTVLTLAMTGGLIFAATGLEERVYILKKPLLLSRNQILMEHMVEMNKTYGFSYHHQAIAAFGMDQAKVEEWLSGKDLNDSPRKSDTLV